MSKLDLVTIYIPTHNRSQMLKRALTSALNQTHSNIEIIVVNDGSSDDTDEVMREYVSRYQRIQYFSIPEAKGACHARNIAIRNANGTYITGLDDDDELEKTHIATLYKAFDPSKYSFVASCTLEDTGSGRFARFDGAGNISLNEVLHNNLIGNQVFTKTDHLIDIGGFDELLPASQDYDAWVRLIERYGPGRKLETATYIWHTGHEGNRITNSSVKRLKALDIFYGKHKHLMNKAHVKSFNILRYKADPTRYSLSAMLKNINKWNYKSALSLYVHSRTPKLGTFWRRLKVKFNK